MAEMETDCPGCHGRLGWYSDDNGQWVSCLNCQAGRERFAADNKTLEETKKICDESMKRLKEQLSKR